MDAKKISEMSDEELVAEVSAQSEALLKYRFQRATGQLENPAKIRVVRKQIARINTLLRERELKARTTG